MNPDVYTERRARLMDKLAHGLIVVRGDGPEGHNANLLYLTGIAEPSATLVMAREGVRIGTGRKNPGPDYVYGRKATQILFLPSADPLMAQWGEDSAATVQSVDRGRLGVDAVLDVSELDVTLGSWLLSADVLHVVRGYPASLAARSDDPDTAFVERIRRRFWNLRVSDGTPIVHEMRRIKDPAEREAILHSIEVTKMALDALVSSLAQGIREHVLEAEIARVYRSHGGTHAFDPIVGCGPNALKLHYRENDGPVENGQLLLVDTGVSIDGYKSDITRTFPVGGRFSDRQRQVYETVLRAQQEAIALCRPGALLGEIHARSFEVIAEAGFTGRDYPHGVGHHLGLETHDVGDVHRPLEAGAVVTVEPGLYLGDEQIGVRIEDDVLVTDSGPEVLSRNIPKTVEEVEGWLRGDGPA